MGFENRMAGCFSFRKRWQVNEAGQEIYTPGTRRKGDRATRGNGERGTVGTGPVKQCRLTSSTVRTPSNLRVESDTSDQSDSFDRSHKFHVTESITRSGFVIAEEGQCIAMITDGVGWISTGFWEWC